MSSRNHHSQEVREQSATQTQTAIQDLAAEN